MTKERAHSSMSEIGAAESRKPTSRVGQAGLGEHCASFRAPTAPECNIDSSSIDDLSSDNRTAQDDSSKMRRQCLVSRLGAHHPQIIIGAQGADARDAGTLSKLKLLTRQSSQNLASTPSQKSPMHLLS